MDAVQRQRNTSYNFSSLAKEEAKEGNGMDMQKLLDTCPDAKKEELAKNLDGFKGLFTRLVDDNDAPLVWQHISPPPKDLIRNYSELNQKSISNDYEILDKLVVMKLNGGLGTSMGCVGPKSTITVCKEFTFLDMQVQQIEALNNRYSCDIPLVLMNSFNTHEETKKVLRKYLHVNVKIHCFQQSQYPRIYKESLRMVAKSVSDNDKESWYPPGHGDMYQSFYNSGLLDQFIEQGKEYLFVSNIDNLGATVDISILDHLLSIPKDEKCEFVMEVTDKTKADVKGGTIIVSENKLRLLEIAQVPKQHVEDFKAVSKFRIFNTNNLWVKLDAIKRIVESKSLSLELIMNHKQLDNGEKIIQIETAIGAAIKCFNKAIGINVPRSRFLPVKTCSDLLLITSNLYSMSEGTLVMSPKRMFLNTPLVQLGTHFKKVKEYLCRFDNIPDIIDLDHLTVAGDVTFGKNVVLKGTVIIIANHGERIDIPSGAILENKIVSGNLRILNH